MSMLLLGLGLWIVVPSLFVVLFSPRLPADPTDVIFPRFVDPAEGEHDDTRRRVA